MRTFYCRTSKSLRGQVTRVLLLNFMLEGLLVGLDIKIMSITCRIISPAPYAVTLSGTFVYQARPKAVEADTYHLLTQRAFDWPFDLSALFRCLLVPSLEIVGGTAGVVIGFATSFFPCPRELPMGRGKVVVIKACNLVLRQ